MWINLNILDLVDILLRPPKSIFSIIYPTRESNCDFHNILMSHEQTPTDEQYHVRICRVISFLLKLGIKVFLSRKKPPGANILITSNLINLDTNANTDSFVKVCSVSYIKCWYFLRALFVTRGDDRGTSSYTEHS